MSREIDSLIAEHVFGDKDYLDRRKRILEGSEDDHVYFYSTKIQDAWLVVEKMQEKGFGFNIATMSEVDYSKNTGWDAWFVKLENKQHFGSWVDGTSSSPKAICLASLKTLWVKV